MRWAVKGASGKGSPGTGLIGAVGDLVVRGGKIGRVEEIAQRQLDRLGHRGLDMRPFLEGKVQRDRHARFRHGDADAMVANQKPQLFLQIVPEEPRRVIVVV